MDLTMNPKVKTIEGKRVGVRSLAHCILGVKGCVGASGQGLRRMTSESIIHTDLHKPNNKLVSAQLEHFWCTNEPWATRNSKDSTEFGLRGSHHLPPYNILCAWPQDEHPNIILSLDSQVEVPKFPKLGLPQLWRPIILCEI